MAMAALYGKVLFETEWDHVYTDGSCYDNGRPYARTGAGVFWGINSSKNKSVQVPGQQSNNRGEVLAVLLALLSSDPCQSLMIFSDSEHVIRSLCYWAPKNAEMGWTCANGDILQDIVKVIRWRVAQTMFIWIKDHAGNDRGDKTDALAKEGDRKPATHIDYKKLHENPWSHTASG